MSVVIGDFEVLPEPPPPAPDEASRRRRPEAPRPRTEDVCHLLARLADRHERVWAH